MQQLKEAVVEVVLTQFEAGPRSLEQMNAAVRQLDVPNTRMLQRGLHNKSELGAYLALGLPNNIEVFAKSLGQLLQVASKQQEHRHGDSGEVLSAMVVAT